MRIDVTCTPLWAMIRTTWAALRTLAFEQRVSERDGGRAQWKDSAEAQSVELAGGSHVLLGAVLVD